MGNEEWIPPKTLEEKVRDFIVPDWLRIRERAWREKRKGEKEIKIIPNLLVNCNRAIDIGANVGVWSYWLSKYAKQVESFEPNPKIFNALKNIKIKNVNSYNIALSNKSGSVDLLIPKGSKGFSNQGASLSSIKVQGEHKSISIEAKCLDEYNFLDVDFIKIDVEGHEHEVIEGAQETINKFKPTMVIEMEEKHNQIPIEDQISSVEKLGYKCCVLINEKIIQIEEVDLNKLHRNPANNDSYLFNFIFYPQ
jgi:FkbM family methyltransferase